MALFLIKKQPYYKRMQNTGCKKIRKIENGKI